MLGRSSIFSSIGYSIAKRLAREGAKVMVSSRKESNVSKAVKSLKEEKGVVEGVVCHVGKEEDRKKLIAEVRGGEGEEEGRRREVEEVEVEEGDGGMWRSEVVRRWEEVGDEVTLSATAD